MSTTLISLEEALAIIQQTFSIPGVLKDLDRDAIVAYFTQAEAAYRRYHSAEDSLHMALNPDGHYDPDGYYAQPRFVSQQIQAIQAQQVLEVGAGKGFNLVYLAQQHPTLTFTGLDLTPLHVKIARQKAAALGNVRFELGSFNAIPADDRTVDLVFGVECLCYATDSHRTLAELHRVLRPGGRLIIFDGWRNPDFDSASADWQTAAQLFEVGVGVQGGTHRLDHWQQTAQQVGFSVLEVTDLQQAVMPNALHLYHTAQRFFNKPRWLRAIAHQLQKHIVRNAITGLLSPLLLTAGPMSYQRLVLQRHPT